MDTSGGFMVSGKERVTLYFAKFPEKAKIIWSEGGDGARSSLLNQPMDTVAKLYQSPTGDSDM